MTKPSKTSAIPLSEKAYRTIRSLILENEFSAGDQILEKVLVEKLNISRTPIREACVQLEKEGLIKIRPRKGIFIKPISAADMNEIYDIMTALESQAAKILATKVAEKTITEQELKQLELPTLRMEEALQQDNLKEWAEADEAFHQCLLDLCGNVRLKQVVLQFWGQAHRVRFFTLELRAKPTDSTADHKAVVEAIRAGDANKAGEIHSLHRQKGKHNLLSIIEKYKFDNL
ncbi:GntR family transcriptional regulator [Paraglaciecola sp. L3A3]|uniref:GntR family transcriptional regulator n=1 Tax=Paraglaciecola sp. L3A3 TaxID=2686358 RepID=UPI00131BC655|nr:GntR family transcriptional regulator [Paraglaciecola sp. L3A3]